MSNFFEFKYFQTFESYENEISLLPVHDDGFHRNKKSPDIKISICQNNFAGRQNCFVDPNLITKLKTY